MTVFQDFGVETLAGLFIITFAAGVARGFSGFGAALIFVPLAGALVGPKVAVPLLLVSDFVASAGMIPDAWRKANLRQVGLMAIGSFVGVPIGAYFLTVVDPLVLRWTIAILVAAMLCLILSGWRYTGKPTRAASIAVGATSGLLSGATQVGGPPVVVYWLGQQIDRQVVRANIVIYFALQSIFTAVSFAAGGLITQDVLSLALVVTPVFAASIWLGSRMFALASEVFFRRACYGLIAIAAIAGMPIWG